MTISDIIINGTTYTDADWRANWEGTISSIANDIGTVIAAASLVGALTKAVPDAPVTLTAGEADNFLFLFTGALTATRAVTFPAGATVAFVVNQTTGGFAITVGYATGTTVTIPASGSAVVYADGVDFTLTDGIARNSSGAAVSGDLSATGNLSITGTSTLTGNTSLAGTLTVTGASTITSLTASGAASLNSTLYVGAAATLNSTLAVAGAATLSAALTVNGAAQINSTLTVTGATTISGSSLTVSSAAGDARYRLTSASGQPTWSEYQLSGVTQWLVGRNAGTDYVIARFDDVGSSLGTPITITRADGYILFNELPTSSAGLPSKAIWNDSGTLKQVA